MKNKILTIMQFLQIYFLSLNKLLRYKHLLLCVICFALCGCSYTDVIKRIEHQDSNLKSFEFYVQDELKHFVIRVYTYEQNHRDTTFEKIYECEDAKNQINFEINSSISESDSIMIYTGKEYENQEETTDAIVFEKPSHDPTYSINRGSSRVLAENEIVENEEIPVYVSCIIHSDADYGASIQHFYETPDLGENDTMHIVTIEFTK